ncbi:tRNA (cmo5U34)-methyltransferase [Desulfosporosinus lacus DSM 15449]|uniref:tRNA (Cmo5U34)-methyltransferase n=1 Tax=Desulfosporosinus lacus DSM 15449 TaxID=1121420 RepID=A0A1M5YMA4_9FIRM|nr:tRNA (cmo5U34)-methyltransferase [Desulfosporosinus lacus DSM 15449]
MNPCTKKIGNKVENSGLSKEEILSAYERVKLDKMSTLDDQINWLKGIGFTDVDCVYKYFNFVVLYGRK